ncbi:PLAC8-like protein 1 [Asterias rubens]|uniref:PLAC8-like protein 1 n=1 Tax=Asterias rubens TaxID=7604 RepID=UPI0014556B7F|nr:PLAC8-like protein 1 [Asterias rubens]
MEIGNVSIKMSKLAWMTRWVLKLAVVDGLWLAFQYDSSATMGGPWHSVPDLLYESYAFGELEHGDFPMRHHHDVSAKGRTFPIQSTGNNGMGKLCPASNKVVCLESSASLTHVTNGEDEMCIACKQYHLRRSEPIIRQPQPRKAQPEYMKLTLDWSTDLFGCMEDEHTCLLGAFCGPCLACSLARQLGESWLVVACVPGGVTALRTKLRMQQNVEGSVCDDCLKLTCCCPLALCQMARELDNAEIGRVG